MTAARPGTEMHVDLDSALDSSFLHLAHNTAIAAALAGGRAALNARSQNLERTDKGFRDLVTSGDYAAEKAVLSCLQATFPEHGILSEEGSSSQGDSAFKWVIDPIDGTTNYYRQLPFFSISVALAHEDEPVVGAVYDPMRDEMFSGLRGHGAFLNGEPIRVSSVTTLGESVFALGLSYDTDTMVRMLEAAARIVPLCSCMRSLGSAALVISYIACGRLDLYVHPGLQPWDAAASAVILREAGGLLSGMDGKPWYFGTKGTLAAAPGVHDEALCRMQDAYADF